MFADPQFAPPATPVAAPLPVGLSTAPPLRVGMIGLGTVGGGVWRVLRRNQALIAARAGRPIQIVAVAARSPERAAAVLGHAPGVRLLADPLALAADPGVDVLLELAGGAQAPREWLLAALAHGKHVVTANKALLAAHGEALAQAAACHGRVLAYEAAVAGSVPVIKLLREALAANRIHALAGILNGTSNYILGRMQAAGLGFAAALAEAQALGYAEADPAFDVDGQDAAHKLALLAANAFGMPVRADAVQVQGIRTLQRGDMAAAAQLGYRIKLLAVARRTAAGHGAPAAVELRVHPALVSAQHPLARVDGVGNGLLVQGDAAGSAFYSGAGAGAEPTASAVLADLVDIARLPTGAGPGVATLGTHARTAAQPTLTPPDAARTGHLLRLLPGTALCEAQAVRTLARAGLTVLRRGWCPADTGHAGGHTGGHEGGAPTLALLTAPAPQALAARAAEQLHAATGAVVRRLAVEALGDDGLQ